MPVSATKYDDQRDCWQEDEQVGRIPTGGCDDEAVIRRGPEGDLWRFANSCAPDGYKRAELSEAKNEEIWNAPYCQDLDRRGDAGRRDARHDGGDR